MPNATAEQQDPSEVPRDAKLMSLLLQAMDIEEHQPSVIPHLLDFSHSKPLALLTAEYVLDILSDAQIFAEHANRNEIDVDDVRLAIEGKVSHSFAYPPSKEVLFPSYVKIMSQYAEKKNSNPLPIVPEKFGVRLPPERHCLTGVNFDLVPKEDEKMGEAENGNANGSMAFEQQEVFDMPDILGDSIPSFALNQPMDQDDYDAL